MSCIAGAILYCSAQIIIPGPLATAPSNSTAWTYVAYYGVPILAQRTGSVPYALPVPRPAPTYDPAIFGGRS